MSRPQAGFTLLEVVVAIAVVGAGFAAGLAAMSGSLRLMRSAGEYEQAMLLARAAMTEALAYPDADIVDDGERDVYQGVEYAYRVEFRPVRLTASYDTPCPFDTSRRRYQCFAEKRSSCNAQRAGAPGWSRALFPYRPALPGSTMRTPL